MRFIFNLEMKIQLARKHLSLVRVEAGGSSFIFVKFYVLARNQETSATHLLSGFMVLISVNTSWQGKLL